MAVLIQGRGSVTALTRAARHSDLTAQYAAAQGPGFRVSRRAVHARNSTLKNISTGLLRSKFEAALENKM